MTTLTPTPTISTTAQARRVVDTLVAETGRHAVLRTELSQHGHPRAFDRVIREYCQAGVLTRVGHGIYGIGRAKVFQIVPEVMPKLGYTILPGKPVRGYSRKSGGAVWRLDRPCHRIIRKRGVQAMFETPHGRLVRPRKRGRSTREQPTRRAIESHFHNFQHCHSLARAEKDLLLRQALGALERFECDDATLAIEGGTALVAYHRMTVRFSEDLTVRLIPSERMRSMATKPKVETVKQIGQALREHITREMPFLRPTRKGRIRKDGVLQTLIYDYDSVAPHDDVIAGIKCELAHIPLLRPVARLPGVHRDWFEAIDPVEIASGKWQALTGRLPQHADSYPDLVRHVHDLSVLSPLLTRLDAERTRAAVMRDNTTRDSVGAVFEELSRRPWKEHYESYMQHMGALPISEFPGSHPPWRVVMAGLASVALDLDMVRRSDRRAIGGLCGRDDDDRGGVGPLGR